MMSWKPEVIVEHGGVWTGNALRFATKEEAEWYAKDLFRRWTACREWRVAEDTARVNYRLVDGVLEHIKVDRQEEGFI
jgi:allophanate hydrolase subunit 2